MMNKPLKPLKRPDPSQVRQKDEPDDYTGDNASDRVLFINLGFFKYGTNDKSHGAAIILSFLLFVLLAVIFVIGFWATNVDWAKECLRFVGTTFVFVAGVAVGRSGKNENSH